MLQNINTTINKNINKKLSVMKIKRLQYKSGLFIAAPSNKTGYNKAWLRDNIYEAIGLEQVKDYKTVLKTFHAILDLLLKHEEKIDWAIKEKPRERYQYIHARFNPETFEEFWDDWSNKQNDSIGALLFKIGDLMDKGIKVIRDEHDLRIIQKLVNYLKSIQYWNDRDNGIWEQGEELHASSIGACLAGLKKISNYVDVPQELIDKGQDALNNLLPRESETKEVDLALVSLIYPYDIVTPEQRNAILKNVEEKLVREKGVIRYIGDFYYNNGVEAEWCFGFPWLAKIYKELGDTEKYEFYMSKTHSIMTEDRDVPELYLGNTDQYNENTPLGWAQAMYLCAVA